jgi:hypothetical protein
MLVKKILFVISLLAFTLPVLATGGSRYQKQSNQHSYSSTKQCGSGQYCDDIQSYTSFEKILYTETDTSKLNQFTYTDKFGYTKYATEFKFDPLTLPDNNYFQLTSATLFVKTSANGYYDSIYAKKTDNTFIAKTDLGSGLQSFNVSSLFDLIVTSSVKFKTVFSRADETFFGAALLVKGKYCPPEISQVPVPASVFLFAPVLVGFMALRRKKVQR